MVGSIARSTAIARGEVDAAHELVREAREAADLLNHSAIALKEAKPDKNPLKAARVVPMQISWVFRLLMWVAPTWFSGQQMALAFDVDTHTQLAGHMSLGPMVASWVRMRGHQFLVWAVSHWFMWPYRFLGPYANLHNVLAGRVPYFTSIGAKYLSTLRFAMAYAEAFEHFQERACRAMTPTLARYIQSGLHPPDSMAEIWRFCRTLSLSRPNATDLSLEAVVLGLVSLACRTWGLFGSALWPLHVLGLSSAFGWAAGGYYVVGSALIMSCVCGTLYVVFLDAIILANLMCRSPLRAVRGNTLNVTHADLAEHFEGAPIHNNVGPPFPLNLNGGAAIVIEQHYRTEWFNSVVDDGLPLLMGDALVLAMRTAANDHARVNPHEAMRSNVTAYRRRALSRLHAGGGMNFAQAVGGLPADKICVFAGLVVMYFRTLWSPDWLTDYTTDTIIRWFSWAGANDCDGVIECAMSPGVSFMLTMALLIVAVVFPKHSELCEELIGRLSPWYAGRTVIVAVETLVRFHNGYATWYSLALAVSHYSLNVLPLPVAYKIHILANLTLEHLLNRTVPYVDDIQIVAQGPEDDERTFDMRIGTTQFRADLAWARYNYGPRHFYGYYIPELMTHLTSYRVNSSLYDTESVVRERVIALLKTSSPLNVDRATQLNGAALLTADFYVRLVMARNRSLLAQLGGAAAVMKVADVLYGVRVESVTATPAPTSPDVMLSVKPTLLVEQEVRPVSGRLPVPSIDIIPPKPDNLDQLTVLAGAAHRIMRSPPVGNNLVIFRFGQFVRMQMEEFGRRFPSACVPPDYDASVPAWIDKINHPESRKNELRRVYEMWKHDIDTLNLKRRHRKCKLFGKDEFLTDEKFCRGISSRSDVSKTTFGPAVKACEKHFFPAVKNCVKGVPVRERAKYVDDLLGNRPGKVFVTDATSSESSFKPAIFDALYPVYERLARDHPRISAILAYFHSVRRGRNVLNAKKFTFSMVGRMNSGEVDTSFMTFCLYFFAASFFIYENYARRGVNWDMWSDPRSVHEGDDAVFKVEPEIMPTSEQYASLCINIKIEERPALSVADFCGDIYDENNMRVVTDPRYACATMAWSSSQDVRASPKRAINLAVSRAMSALCQYPGHPMIQAQALRILELYPVKPEVIDKFISQDRSLSAWDRDNMSAAAEWVTNHPPPPVELSTRVLVERQFGVSVSEQIRLETAFASWNVGDPPIETAFDCPHSWQTNRVRQSNVWLHRRSALRMPTEMPLVRYAYARFGAMLTLTTIVLVAAGLGALHNVLPFQYNISVMNGSSIQAINQRLQQKAATVRALVAQSSSTGSGSGTKAPQQLHQQGGSQANDRQQGSAKGGKSVGLGDSPREKIRTNAPKVPARVGITSLSKTGPAAAVSAMAQLPRSRDPSLIGVPLSHMVSTKAGLIKRITPTKRTRNGLISLVGSEYLTPVSIPTAFYGTGPVVIPAGGVLFSMPLNPLYFEGLRVGAELNNYSQFRIRRLAIEYVPTCPATQPGALVGVVMPGSTSNPTLSGSSQCLRDAMERPGAAAFGVFTPAVTGQGSDQLPWYDTETLDDSTLSVPGIFYLLAATDISGSTTLSVDLGMLWMHYDIEVRDPAFENQTQITLTANQALLDFSLSSCTFVGDKVFISATSATTLPAAGALPSVIMMGTIADVDSSAGTGWYTWIRPSTNQLSTAHSGMVIYLRATDDFVAGSQGGWFVYPTLQAALVGGNAGAVDQMCDGFANSVTYAVGAAKGMKIINLSGFNMSNWA